MLFCQKAAFCVLHNQRLKHPISHFYFDKFIKIFLVLIFWWIFFFFTRNKTLRKLFELDNHCLSWIILGLTFIGKNDTRMKIRGMGCIGLYFLEKISRGCAILGFILLTCFLKICLGGGYVIPLKPPPPLDPFVILCLRVMNKIVYELSKYCYLKILFSIFYSENGQKL